MTSLLGARRLSGRSTRGFTLVEVLLVLALLALLGAVLIPATGALFRGAEGETAENVIAATFQEVRRSAVLSGREVALRFDAEAARLRWEGGERAIGVRGDRLDFLQPRGGSAVLIGGERVDTSVVDQLVFYPDGTCDAVRVQWRPATGSPQVMAIDPWTCAPGLEVKP